MKCPIRCGKLNKWHFCILATVVLKLLNALISGVSPTIENKFFLFGFEPIFINHPFIQSSFSFLGIFLLGLILYIKNKTEKKQTYIEEGLLEIKNGRGVSTPFNDRADVRNIKFGSFNESIFVILIFAFAILSLQIYDSFGFNEVKIWPLEYLIIYLFSKKILNKILYKHQKLALILILIFCNIGCLITSFMSDGNSECNIKDERCVLSKKNIYDKIIYKLGWIFIPIFIILYIVSMTALSYGMVKIKYLMDFKFLEHYEILMILGILGFLMSIISVIIATYIQCVNGKNIHMNEICRIRINDKLYFDSFFNYFESLKGSSYTYVEIFVAIPIFQVINSLHSLFNVLIIKKLDPFYLLPIRSLFYIIYRSIDYGSISYSTTLFTAKYILHEVSNLFLIICSLVYLEIIILNFNNYEKDVKECIIEREKIDVEIANEEEEESEKIEIEIGDTYLAEF